MKGEVATTNQILFNQRAITDEILLKLPTWPDGLKDANIQLKTKSDLIYMLSDIRGRVSTIAIDFHDVLIFYSRIIHLFIRWVLVIFPLLCTYLFENAQYTCRYYTAIGSFTDKCCHFYHFCHRMCYLYLQLLT